MRRLHAGVLLFQQQTNVALYPLVKAFANEWASQGVNVNAIAPGYISTDNTEALRNDPTRSGQILARIPAGRWGDADDFKGPAVLAAFQAAGSKSAPAATTSCPP